MVRAEIPPDALATGLARTGAPRAMMTSNEGGHGRERERQQLHAQRSTHYRL